MFIFILLKYFWNLPQITKNDLKSLDEYKYNNVNNFNRLTYNFYNFM